MIHSITTADLSTFSHRESDSVVVAMPCTNMDLGRRTAEILQRRAGMPCTILVIEDILRQGFIKTVNTTFRRITCKYFIYLAQDAYPGRNWLQCAHTSLEQNGKGLLAFNDGKWQGRIASFGMVRTDWVTRLYAGDVFFPGYRAHKADNELTVIARAHDMFVYNPECTLMEYDPEKDFAGSNKLDDALFRHRFVQGFAGWVPAEHMRQLAQEYKINLNPPPTIHTNQAKPTGTGVSLIIVTKDPPHHLDNLIKTFTQINTHKPVELIIVDHSSTQLTNNNSPLTTHDIISKHVAHAFIRHIRRDRHYTFSESCNFGAARAKHPYLLFLNDDISYTEDVLGKAVAKLGKDVDLNTGNIEIGSKTHTIYRKQEFFSLEFI